MIPQPVPLDESFFVFEEKENDVTFCFVWNLPTGGGGWKGREKKFTGKMIVNEMFENERQFFVGLLLEHFRNEPERTRKTQKEIMVIFLIWGWRGEMFFFSSHFLPFNSNYFDHFLKVKKKRVDEHFSMFVSKIIRMLKMNLNKKKKKNSSSCIFFSLSFLLHS